MLFHGHVKISLNSGTFPLIVLIKIVQIIKITFFETRFVINNTTIPPLKKDNSYTWLDYVVSEIFVGVHFGWWKSTYRSYSFHIDVCFLLFWKLLSKQCCLNKVIFPLIVVKILRYITHSFSFKVQPIRTMTVRTIEL